MKKFERFATRHPIAFGFLLILLFSISSTLTWPITQIETSPEGYEVGTAAAKLVIAACFLLLLWGFGWLKRAGFTSVGNRQTWIWAGVLIIYNAIFSIYAFTGSFRVGLPGISLTLAILLFTFATSLVEETMYRGLLLTAMVRAWGVSRKGLYAAAILSGLFWASLHFFNLLIRPFPVVALQVFGMTLVGFVYAAIVLSGRSIWPTIVFHWVVNASTNLQLAQTPNFEETTSVWLIFNLVVLPVVVWGIFLLRKVPLTPNNEKEEEHYENQFEPLNI